MYGAQKRGACKAQTCADHNGTKRAHLEEEQFANTVVEPRCEIFVWHNLVYNSARTRRWNVYLLPGTQRVMRPRSSSDRSHLLCSARVSGGSVPGVQSRCRHLSARLRRSMATVRSCLFVGPSLPACQCEQVDTHLLCNAKATTLRLHVLSIRLATKSSSHLVTLADYLQLNSTSTSRG